MIAVFVKPSYYPYALPAHGSGYAAWLGFGRAVNMGEL